MKLPELWRIQKSRKQDSFAADAFPLGSFRKKLVLVLLPLDQCCFYRGISRSDYSDEDCELLYWEMAFTLVVPFLKIAEVIY